MATSGSWDYSLTAAGIIQAALEDIGVVLPGGTVGTADSTLCLTRLNLIAKQFSGKADMAQGVKIWTRQRLIIFLVKGKAIYNIGPAAGDDHATALYGRTTISANEAAGQTTLSITSNTDTTTFPGTTVTMANTNNIGIVQNDGTLFWTTISGTPGATADVVAGLTVAANAGNYVYWYAAASKAQRFPVLEHILLRSPDLTDMDLDLYTDVDDFESLADKTAPGLPISVLFEPQRITSRLTLDYYASDVTYQLRATVQYPAEDYDATTNDIAYPQEWLAALEWELAHRIAPVYGRPWTKDMQDNYTGALGIARQLNPENTDLYFQCGPR